MLIMMYVTLLPVIVAGGLNMAFCKSGLFGALAIPIDAGKCLKDGKRIFGDNKTLKGFAGYLVINTICYAMWGVICRALSIEHLNLFYAEHENTLLFNLLIGFLVGLGYALFELPNSFMKRRLDITPGRTVSGGRKVFFIFLDQADSIFGVALVVWLFYDLGIKLYLLYVLVGAGTHIVVNLLLYAMKLRKTPV